ncbi:DUF4870 domain-containing protein [Aquimarina agarilytica]|uniref:DUF4870 domain-containing protein n=1 Tax=Aquimarina agarilytica TaxID=1087449 RepID=UPI0002891F48|nr:DUF4870 domain-containing protein [Aquimarina agarilytica]
MENSLEKSNFRPWDMELKQFCVLMHIAQFAGYVIPLAGFVLPFIMWHNFKDKNESIDQHGKNIVNWMISAVIYGALFGVLCFFLIGFPLLFVLGACATIFPILGALKANEGNFYKYPFTIEFFK